MALGLLPPANMPFLNPQTGLVNTEWYLALRNILHFLGSGILVGTGSAGQAVTRSIVGGYGIEVTDGSGVGGNPTVTALGPDGFGFNVGGLMSVGELLGAGVLDEDISFPSATRPPVVVSQFPATASAVLNIKALIAGVETQVGTITFAAGGTTGVVAWSPSPYTLPSGTPLRLYAPSPRDITLSMITGLVPGDL